MYKVIINFTLIALLFSMRIHALEASSNTLVINEINSGPATAGDPATNDDEWIELYVASSSAIDLTGWVLTDQDTNAKDSGGCTSFATCNYIFPQVGGSDCFVSPGDYVLVYTGTGSNSCSGSVKKFYMGAGGSIWNNAGDDVGLYRPDASCTTEMVVNGSGARASQNYRPVDYVEYGSGVALDNYPGESGSPTTTCTPVSDWDWTSNPTAPQSSETLSLKTNGVDSDSGADWEISGTTTTCGPNNCAGSEGGGSPGWSNNENPTAITLSGFRAWGESVPDFESNKALHVLALAVLVGIILITLLVANQQERGRHVPQQGGKW